MLYRYQHTVPDCLASGRPLFFGDEVELTEGEANEAHNQTLREENRLVVVTLPQETPPRSRRKTPTTKENS